MNTEKLKSVNVKLMEFWRQDNDYDSAPCLVELVVKENIHRYAHTNVHIQAEWRHTRPQVGKSFITVLWSPVTSPTLDAYICMSIPVYITLVSCDL